jgi:hypothetical protein
VTQTRKTLWFSLGLLSLIPGLYLLSILLSGSTDYDQGVFGKVTLAAYTLNVVFAVIAFRLRVNHKIAWVLCLLLAGVVLNPIFWVYAQGTNQLDQRGT